MRSIKIYMKEKLIAMNSEKDELLKAIGNSGYIAVVSHINPDGDNLGSVLGLGMSLVQLGKKVDFIKPDIIPDDYNFLPGVERLSGYGELRDKLDLLIVLDCSDPTRLGENQKLIDVAKVVVNVDHHVSNTMFGDILLVDPKASSTGELVFDIIEDLNLPIDEEIATCLYTAITTDTGRFSYQSVTASTHRIAASLYELGINGYEINKRLYQTRSLKRTRLFSRAMAEMELMFEGKGAVVKISRRMLEETGASMEDTEGIVEFLRDTESVEAACILKEMDENLIKASIRTKDPIDANKICGAFGGGGHIRASGCTISATMEEAAALISDEIKRHIE